MRVFAAICAATLLVACAPKPNEQDIRAVLAEHLPQSLKPAVGIEKVQAETTSVGDDSAVKFKAVLKASEALYDVASSDEVAIAAGERGKLSAEIEGAAQGLSPTTREKFKPEVERATVKPTFIKEVTPVGSTSDWYGSFKARKVVDKQLASEFKTEVEPKLLGQPRSSFPPEAVNVAEAKAWFADLRPKQEALLQRLRDASALEEKDAELAKQQGELAKQQAATQQEREQKEALIAAQEKQARRLPLQLEFRHAALGGTFVMRLQAPRPMTIRLEVARGLQKFGRDLQLPAGRVVEIGHLEGWGFKPGDQVSLSNPSFDSASFVVR